MSILKWEDGETHEFVVIGKVGAKRHFNKKQGRSVLCTGKSSCWFCQHGFDYEGVTIGIAIYSPVAIEESHYPWVNFTPNSYRAIKQILGPTKNWYGHRLQLSRKGESFDTRYAAKDLGKVKDSKLEKWVKEREELFAFDAGEEWDTGEPGEPEAAEEMVAPPPTLEEEEEWKQTSPATEELVEGAPPPGVEDIEGEKVYLQELIASAQMALERLEGNEAP